MALKSINIAYALNPVETGNLLLHTASTYGDVVVMDIDPIADRHLHSILCSIKTVFTYEAKGSLAAVHDVLPVNSANNK